MLGRLATLSASTAGLYGWTADQWVLSAGAVAFLIVVASHLWHDR